MALHEINISKASRGKGAAVLVFGVPGVGKTRFVGTSPNALIIRPPEDHTNSILAPSKIDEIIVQGWADMEASFRYLQQGGHKKYDWAWLDSLSLYQDVGLRDLFDKAVERNSHRAEYGLDKGEYGINQFRIQSWVRNMVALAEEGNINFGITCHTMDWYDPIREANVWAPNIQGREGLFMSKICGMMNSVCYYYKTKVNGKVARVLRTDDGGKDIFVKDQLDLAPKGRLVNPTMADIVKVLNNTTRPRRRKKV